MAVCLKKWGNFEVYGGKNSVPEIKETPFLRLQVGLAIWQLQDDALSGKRFVIHWG